MDVPQFTPTDKDLLQSMDQGQFKGFSFVNPYFGVQQWVGPCSRHCKVYTFCLPRAVFHVVAEITWRDLSSVSGCCGMYQKAGQNNYPWALLDQRDDIKDWAPYWIGNRLYGACFIIALLEDYGRFQIATTTTINKSDRLFAMLTSDHFVDKYTLL